MFELYLENRPIDVGVNYESLSRLTHNYVSSDIKFLIDEASRLALKTRERITQEMLEQVIRDIQPSISSSELQKYQLLKEKMENKTEIIPKKNPIGFIHNTD